MSKPDKKIWIREFYLDNHLEHNTAFNFSNKPLNGYIPITIVRGHDPHHLLEDVKELPGTSIVETVQKAIDSVPPVPYELKASAHKDVLPIKCRWIIKHKTNGHKTVTAFEYDVFDPTKIHEYGNNCYFNYEAIGPYIEKY